jgi:hypothetical protein
MCAIAVLASTAVTLGAGVLSEYSRSFTARRLDQATLDAEGYGEKDAFKREEGGLRITLAPGKAETGWKTPPQVRFGGNFKIAATAVITKLPKPAQEDGVAVGVAIAQQDFNQPDITFLRVREPSDAQVYRTILKPMVDPNQMMMNQMVRRGRRMIMMNPGNPGAPAEKPAKVPRVTFPAGGDTVRFMLEREGSSVRLHVLDTPTGRPRYLGAFELQPMDIAAVKLFVSNRNGAEPVNVVWKDITIQAERVNGLGTIVRTVFGETIYADPTSLDKDVLVIGGPPKQPAPAEVNMPNGKDAFRPLEGAVADAKKPATPAGADAATSAPATAAAAAPAAAPAATVAAAAPAPAPAVAMVQAAGTVAVARTTAAQARAAARAAALAQNPGAAGEPAGQKAAVRVRLDELESIRFERQQMLTGRVVGQPNLDLTRPGTVKKDEPAKADATKGDPARAESKKADDQPKAEAKKAEPEKAEAKEAKPAKAEVKKDATKKADDKKDDAQDDALAPPPGTTITKIESVPAKKNGIRDLHLALFGLRDAKIRQITINCMTDGGPTMYRLDSPDSQNWPIVMRRAGNDLGADLYIEPPATDCFQKQFMIMIMYEDNQQAQIAFQSDQHSDAKLAVDTKTAVPPPTDVVVYMLDDEKLTGKFDSLGPETVTIMAPWNDKLAIPLSRVIGVHFGLLDRKETPESFANRLKNRGSEDVLLAQTKDGEVVTIAGIVEGTDKDRLKFSYQGKTRTLPLRVVEGLVLATRESKSTDELRPSFSLPAGAVVSGRWDDLDATTWKITAPWGQVLKIPANDIQGVKFRGGKMTYLSDLTPSKVDETPFFGRKLPFQRNGALTGGPLKMDGQTYERGLAVHSRSELTYDLDSAYTTFEALVGFDDAANAQGRVDCRVIADGKELYQNPDLRGDAPPVKLSLPVAGVTQLKLVIDFGAGQDTGDRVIWANARLERKQPVKASSR